MNCMIYIINVNDSNHANKPKRMGYLYQQE